MLIHHNKLRRNAVIPDGPNAEDQLDVLRESGWAKGPHKDTDPNDPMPVPGVLAEAVAADEQVDEAAADKPAADKPAADKALTKKAK